LRKNARKLLLRAKKQIMTIHSISSAGHGTHNEDLVVVFEQQGLTDIIIIDGATSVARQDYIDAEAGDVVWFVRGFAAALEQAISASRSQADSVQLAIDQLRSDYRSAARGEVPLYAWPIAAMTWVRIWDENRSATLQAYCLGDCKALLRLPDSNVVDIDPYINPYEEVLQAEIARLAQEGVTDPAARRERLLPMLRGRREFQNMAAAPMSLCLQPRGPFEARQTMMSIERGTQLLMMTDGFYRLVDPYRLYTPEQLAAACSERGLGALLKELRDFEKRGAASMAVKSADDASAILWCQ
jgi:hypothetical protein